MLNLAWLLIAMGAGAGSAARELALTFDDSPRAAEGFLSGPERARLLIEGLRRAGVAEAAFFAVSSQLDAEGRRRVMSFADAGHVLANHTHSHPHFNDVSLSEFRRDFEEADAVLSRLPNFERWFRFPYLREGDTAEKRDGMRAALAARGYRNAYITLNNYDFYLDDLFQREIRSNPGLSFGRLRDFFVTTLVDSIEHYDRLAWYHLGRSPRHVLLLHETDLTALFAADLVAALRAAGWRVISPREAYADPIANYSSPSVLARNPGRIGEVAFDRGQHEGLWPATCENALLDHQFAKFVRSL